ncbi:MAG: hypothetical protein LQ343_005114 [Gyalolechia ehrenbergii]|nr:MAG: hypothetical protein LQ343_005114 [Gyalolechia ehrenbergii]
MLQFNPCAFTTSNNLTCQCDSGNRAATAGCEKVSCSPTDYDKTQTLARELCSPLYANSSLDATPVSAAISTATAAAVAAVNGKDVTNPNDYPPCATACQLQNVPQSECRSLSNVSCVCSSRPLNTTLGGCEQRTCSRADLQTVRYLAYKLCAPVGGINNASEVANQTIATQTAGSVPEGPTGVMPFTGGAAALCSGVEGMSWVLLGVVFGAMGLSL